MDYPDEANHLVELEAITTVLAIIGGCTDTACKKACLASFGARPSNFLTVLQHIVGSECVTVSFVIPFFAKPLLIASGKCVHRFTKHGQTASVRLGALHNHTRWTTSTYRADETDIDFHFIPFQMPHQNADSLCVNSVLRSPLYFGLNWFDLHNNIPGTMQLDAACGRSSWPSAPSPTSSPSAT